MLDIENCTFCFTSLVDIKKELEAGVGGYSFLLKRKQNFQQGAAEDKYWSKEKQSVEWHNHINHRLSQHNSRENAEDLKCVYSTKIMKSFHWNPQRKWTKWTQFCISWVRGKEKDS